MKFTQTNHRDLELWLGVKNDDDSAFRELFNRYWEPLVNFAGIYLPDRSKREEVLQEVFMELFIKRINITIETSFSSYLVSFARNRILNYMRHRSIYKKHVSLSINNKVFCHNTTEDTFNLRQTQAKINSILNDMPVKYKQVYVLNKEYKLTVMKTARMLNRPVATVEKQLRRALTLIREGLKENV